MPSLDTNQSGYYYDDSTEKWVKSTANSTLPTTEEKKEETTNGSSPTETDESTSGVSGDTKKKYREIEYCTLEGDVVIIPTVNTIKLHAGDTINFVGLGSYLSGLYYIARVSRTVDSSGYSQTMTLIKTGFGDSLKAKTKPVTIDRKDEIQVLSLEELKVGDKVKVIGDNAVYSGSSEGKKIPNWVKKKELTISKLSKGGDKALLKEILSWTYVKYLKAI